ncbi:MAG: hypothetical protein FD166_3608 [Bacteroidetes bacterium]|nr:MAG: hypothetical protein FD166_3608 [Bacteroidota bacterium]
MAKEKKPVKLTETVKIVATEKAKHMVPGQEYEVHPTQAELLKKKGWAEDPKKGKKAE